MAALEAEQFGGAADVVAGLFNLLEDVFALVRIAGLLQRGETPRSLRAPDLCVSGGSCLRSMRSVRGLRISTRSITFFSSRTLPGQ